MTDPCILEQAGPAGKDFPLLERDQQLAVPAKTKERPTRLTRRASGPPLRHERGAERCANLIWGNREPDNQMTKRSEPRSATPAAFTRTPRRIDCALQSGNARRSWKKQQKKTIAIRENMARLRELRLAKEAEAGRTEVSTGNRPAKAKPKKRFR